MFKTFLAAIAVVLVGASLAFATDCRVQQQRIVQFQQVPVYNQVQTFIEVPQLALVNGYPVVQQQVVVEKVRVEKARVERRPVRARSRSVKVERVIQR